MKWQNVNRLSAPTHIFTFGDSPRLSLTNSQRHICHLWVACIIHIIIFVNNDNNKSYPALFEEFNLTGSHNVCLFMKYVRCQVVSGCRLLNRSVAQWDYCNIGVGKFSKYYGGKRLGQCRSNSMMWRENFDSSGQTPGKFVDKLWHRYLGGKLVHLYMTWWGNVYGRVREGY